MFSWKEATLAKSLGSDGSGLGVHPRDDAWTLCGSDIFIPQCLIWWDFPRLAAKQQKLCNHLSLSCCDLGAHTHNSHCPANGYIALEGQSSGKCSFGWGKKPHTRTCLDCASSAPHRGCPEAGHPLRWCSVGTVGVQGQPSPFCQLWLCQQWQGSSQEWRLKNSLLQNFLCFG